MTVSLNRIPRTTTTLEEKGNVYSYLGRHNDAIAAYDTALKINPKIITIWFEKGYALMKIHRYSDAIECFNLMLALDTEYTCAMSNKRYALNELGRYKEASVLRQNSRIPPKHYPCGNGKRHCAA